MDAQNRSTSITPPSERDSGEVPSPSEVVYVACASRVTFRHSGGRHRLNLGVTVVLALLAGTMVPASAQAVASTSESAAHQAGFDAIDVAEPRVDSPISDAEMADLEDLASQRNVSVDWAISRFGWNDNFALTVNMVRDLAPDAFTDARIVDAQHAWIAFAGVPPDAALELVREFTAANRGVVVDTPANMGFTETDVMQAVEAVHFALMDSPGVAGASTSFDIEARELRTIVVPNPMVADVLVEELEEAAGKTLDSLGNSLAFHGVTTSVVLARQTSTGGVENNNQHLGGEDITGCTSAFVTVTAQGTRGISTAGHCGNAQSDDGQAFVFQAQHVGNLGDFQWHTGPQPRLDDFYSGNAAATEVNLRDVAAVANAVVGQSLCVNGVTTHKSCDVVRQLNVCDGAVCNLVQMETHLTDAGDSGGPWFWGNTAYGVHRGYVWDPFWPFDRSVFSRLDRMFNALGITVATT